MKNRQKYIGASDIHQVLSLPPYGCARRLLYEKRGVPADYPQIENEHIRRGKFYEPIALKLYQKETGRVIAKRITLEHPEYPFMVAHPDGIVCNTKKQEYSLINAPVEVKCPTRRNFEKMKYEGLGEAYILQIQYQIGLAKLQNVPEELIPDMGVSINFCPETTDRLYFSVKMDRDLVNMIFARVREFWVRVVQGGEEVIRLEPTDRRCQPCLWRKTCQGEALVEGLEGGEIETDMSLAPLTEEYQKAKAIVGEAEEYLEDVRGRLLQAMGGRQAVVAGGARIYFRPQESWRWDTKLLANKHPELEGEFKKKIITRPLRIYPC